MDFVAVVTETASAPAGTELALPPYTTSRLVRKHYEDSSIGCTLKTDKHITKVETVIPGSAAEAAGLVAGDIVKTINGEDVESATFGCSLLITAPPGFVEIIVTTTAPERVAPPRELGQPMKSPFDSEIEYLPDPATEILRYDQQVAEIINMGFTDADAVLHALRACKGDVQKSVDRLLSAAS